MLEILLYFLAPFVGLLPIDKLFSKKTAVISKIIFFTISAILIYPILFTDFYYTNTNMNVSVKTMALSISWAALWTIDKFE